MHCIHKQVPAINLIDESSPLTVLFNLLLFFWRATNIAGGLPEGCHREATYNTTIGICGFHIANIEQLLIRWKRRKRNYSNMYEVSSRFVS